MDVSLVVFDKAAFKLSQELHGDVQSFIDEHLVDMRERMRRVYPEPNNVSASYISLESARVQEDSAVAQRDFSSYAMPAPSAAPSQKAVFDGARAKLDESFSTSLLRLIDQRGKTDVEVYKRANIDRKLFSKIRGGKGYMPSKKTAVALAVALELSLTETSELLGRAGFALSRSMMFDVIIEYFISHKRYDIFEINNVLFEYDQPLLGG